MVFHLTGTFLGESNPSVDVFFKVVWMIYPVGYKTIFFHHFLSKGLKNERDGSVFV